MDGEIRPELQALRERIALTLDDARDEARQKRYAKGYRTARENVADLVDEDSFQEYGQLAVAAQRSRRDYRDLQSRTAADGIITGTCTINTDLVGAERARAAVIVNDYSVLAGTQGFFHHRKLDRICELAEQQALPLVMYTEGGGGRPGDTDVTTQIAGLNIKSFSTWASLSGVVPRIAVNNGYCFAGNAALFGCADFCIATRNSWIGMAGPAMIEGGGMGKHEPTAIGPIEVQEKNGVVDIVADDEAHATAIAKQLLSYFQGDVSDWEAAPQILLRDTIPEDRRWGYPVRRIIETLADTGSFLELQRIYGRGIITGFIRLEGKPVALIANDCQQLGGAVDAVSSEKAARFLQVCDAFSMPVLSLTDTPGFMVGPDSEQEGAVRRMSSLFLVGSRLRVPIVTIFLRKAYGLGAMAMTGGTFVAPVYAAAWPTGEFGGMGLEGAVRLGFKKELEAEEDPAAREQLFQQLVARMYEIGKASEAASYLELDAVIDPADTRAVVLRALRAAKPSGR
ncbi:Methylmalonyl-CoA carboxyltransferase 12S subunit [Halioglobus japonicus]|nr:Methylmalonyl-CoA carboxyltransferase 12S subunit [Halioglobus japonicus]